MIDLLSLLPEELQTFLQENNYPKFRCKQIYSWLPKGIEIQQMNNLPKDLRDFLLSTCEWRLPKVKAKQESKLDGTIKYLFELIDGLCIESVFMKYHHGNTLCISSEVGCPMGCKFCASTIGGKVRNLTPSEMLGQIIAAQKDTGERISNVVMMGIGEPLDNYDNVIQFLKLVNCEGGLNIGYRHISLSTCGIVPKIYALAKEEFPITLSVSLHAPTNEKRSLIMPVNNKYPVEVLLKACADYYDTTERRISFEYTLISGKNDSLADARELAMVLKKQFAGQTKEKNVPIHVNLIRVNEVSETGFHHGTKEEADLFAKELEKLGLVATVRRRLGSDIDAACGQLRKKYNDQNNQ